MSRSILLALAVALPAALAAGLPAVCVAADAPRFVAEWSDGSHTAADEVTDWHRDDRQPKLADRPLFDAKLRLRSLVDTQLPPSEMDGPAVELIGGDRLPGRVVAYEDGTSTSGANAAAAADDGPHANHPAESGPPPVAHLLVETPLTLDLPGIAGRTRIPVLAGAVRRIVGDAGRGAAVQPGHIRLQDGRQQAFLSLRWRSSGVDLVGQEGLVHLDFDEIADLALPLTPAAQWESLVRDWAILAPRGDSPRLRLETIDGLRVTTSLERFSAHTLGGDEPAQWLHIVGPAWCPQPLGVPHRRVRTRQVFGPDELPLTCLTPLVDRHRAVLSAAWAISRVDRNVQGGPLRNRGFEHPGGLGVHAEQELTFALPAVASSFECRVGLDAQASRGGAARARVLVDGARRFESPLLVGSQQQASVPAVKLGPRAKRLSLVADMARDAPSGSDPFDIRDLVDWLEPVLRCDPQQLALELERAMPAPVPGWTIEPPAGGAWRLANALDIADRAAPAFRSRLELSGPVVLTRVETVPADKHECVLWLARPLHAVGQPTVEISLDGRRGRPVAVPEMGDQGEFRPIAMPWSDAGSDRDVEIRVRIDPAAAPALVDFRGVSWQ